ncbi:MAG: 2,3-diphosphoglycerate-dependent phosphoglycerate mutase [Candidatus Levybacteria bacterium]|nr:2,3-diphosphoglycerate-dependent phosphoglycerate mutase [Candidatus Levybacteria bacterium]
MAHLILVRHGESEWNAKGLWTGWTDVNLSENGREEAKKAGEALKDIHLDVAFTSALKRAQQTLEEIQGVLGTNLEPIADKALNERSYGDFTGKNKWEVKEQIGEEEFQKIRRSWDYPPANGESLKMVYERVLPYYQSEIEPKIKEGKNVIIAAHGNSLRALIKYLENISDEEITKLELPTGGLYVYELDGEGNVTAKEIRGTNTNTH